ncbi:MAG: serine O-acetyltransferase [Cyanobacteria bacterium J06614_10]
MQENCTVFKAIVRDFRIIFDRDPAARNWLEVALLYPGFQALVLHRLAHGLWNLGLPFVPRFISHVARALTGVEIHPGATIGSGVFIDHGMGVVIGETAIVGDLSLIYQGVTLGGTGKESGKRHPTLGTGVIVGAGAKVLGDIQIGNDVRIGAGSVVLREVPSDCTVVGVPGRVVYRSGERVDPLEHGRLPDSEALAIRALVDRIDALENELAELRQRQDVVVRSLDAQPVESDVYSLEQLVSVAPGLAKRKPVAEKCDGTLCCSVDDRALQEFLGGSGL